MTVPPRPTIVALIAFAACSSCSEELAPPAPDRPTIETRVFAGALSDLVVARIELLPDTAAYQRRSEEILERSQVSAEDLRDFVRSHGQDDDLMAGVYARVSARLDSLYPITRPGAADLEAGLDSLIGAAPVSDP